MVSQASSGNVDQQQLYGRYDRVADARADIETDQLRWRNRWAEKVAHRAVNQPLDAEAEEMHVDNRQYGLGAKELSIIGVIGTVVCSVITFLVWQIVQLQTQPDMPRAPAPYNYVPPVHVPTEHVPQQRTDPQPHQHSDRDTLMIPRLRFGPDG